MRRHQLRCLELLALSLIFLSINISVFASRAGTLDPGFGTGGVAFAQVPDMNAQGPRDIVVQPDGKIIVVGTSFQYPNGVVSLARWNADGSLDTGFGNGGVVITDLLPKIDFSNSITLQPDGKIIIAGETMKETPGEKGYDLEIFLVRYNANGSLDTSFDNDGVVFTPYGANDVINDIALQPDGKILIGGYAGGFLLVRYNSNGSLDTGFDGDGIAASASTFAGNINSMTLQPDGKIVLAGSSHTNVIVARYDANGAMDSTFDGDGVVSIPTGTSVEAYGSALQPDGKILIAGAARINFAGRTEAVLLRLNPDGSPDTGFDHDSLAITNAPNGPGTTLRIGDEAREIIVLNNGKIVVIGVSTQNPQSYFLIMRYRPDGSPDTGFDGDGIAALTKGGGNCLTLQPDGKILTGGNAVVNSTTYSLGASRFLMRSNPFSDFDGDGKTDISVFRPSSGTWYAQYSSNGSFDIDQFGSNGDLTVPSDYDGDGKTDIAVWRPSNGVWFWINSSNGTVGGNQFGVSQDRPVPSDYDGDGKSDIAIFRPATGHWWIFRSSDSSVVVRHFGVSEDKPVIGDFDGDGIADLAVFRPSNGTWYRLNSGDGAFVINSFGLSGDKPVATDHDGDGKTDIAVFRPSNGAWYWINSSTGSVSGALFGLSDDRPVPGDYDGDGRSEPAVFRPGQNTWYLLRSTQGFTAQLFGSDGDIPVPNSFVQ